MGIQCGDFGIPCAHGPALEMARQADYMGPRVVISMAMQALGSVPTTIPSALPHAMLHLHALGIVWSASKKLHFCPYKLWGMVQLLWVLTTC